EMGQETRLPEAAAAGEFTELPHRSPTDGCLQSDFGAEAGAIGCGADAFHFQPMVVVAIVAIKEIRPAALPIRDEEIQKTVVVVIRPGTPSRVTAIIDQTARDNPRKSTVAVVVVEPVVLSAVIS